MSSAGTPAFMAPEALIDGAQYGGKVSDKLTLTCRSWPKIF